MSTITTPCPEMGAWRAWLDHDADTPDLGSHLESCTECTRLVADLRETADTAASALASIAPSRMPSAREIAVARERLAWPRRQAAAEVPAAPEPVRLSLLTRVSTGWRIAGSSIAAALALSLLVAFTPEGRTAAAAFLAQFRSQQLAAVEVSPQSQADIIRTLSALGNLGTITSPNSVSRNGTPLPRLQEPRAATLAEASQQVGFALLRPNPSTLPAGMDSTPKVQVIPANEVRFTFDKNKARTYYQSTGHPEVNLPDKFDGASLTVSVPAAALLQYGGTGSRDALIVGQAGELVINVDGKVTLDEMRDFLLGLPGLPKDVTDQLKLIRNWNQTLPIPIPVDKVNWRAERFNGAQGLLLNDNSGLGSAAIWQANGHLYGVAGSIKATELKRIADGLN